MKRSIDRSKRLPAFLIDLAALKLFTGDVAAVFQGTKPRINIQLSLSGENLEFASVEEIESYAPMLPESVSDFRLSWWGENDSYCRLTWSLFSALTVHASSPDQAWSAGVIAVVEKHALMNRRWYAFFRPWHFWLSGTAGGFLPGFVHWEFHRDITDTTASRVAWIALVLVQWLFYFTFYLMFPARTLLIRKHENWFRRYFRELTFAVALLSLIVSLIALFKTH